MKSVPSVDSDGTESRAPRGEDETSTALEKALVPGASLSSEINQWPWLCGSAVLLVFTDPPVYIDQRNGNVTGGMSLSLPSPPSAWLKAIKALKITQPCIQNNTTKLKA